MAWGADASSQLKNISLDHWFARHLCPGASNRHKETGDTFQARLLGIMHSKPVRLLVLSVLCLSVLCTFVEIIIDAEQDCKLFCDEEGQISHDEASLASESETASQDYSLCDIETELNEDLEPLEEAVHWMIVAIVIFQVSELTLLIMALGKSFFEHILYVLDVFVVGVVCLTLILDSGTEARFILFLRLWRIAEVFYDIFLFSMEATEEEGEGEQAKKKEEENAQGKMLARRMTESLLPHETHKNLQSQENFQGKLLAVMHSTTVRRLIVLFLLIDVLTLMSEMALMSVEECKLKCEAAEVAETSSLVEEEGSGEASFNVESGASEVEASGEEARLLRRLLGETELREGCEFEKELTEDEETFEEVLHIVTLCSLSVFSLELILLMIALDVKFFYNPLYVLDVIVTGITLVTDLAVSEPEGSLVIFLRLWRCADLCHGIFMVVSEARELEEPEVEKDAVVPIKTKYEIEDEEKIKAKKALEMAPVPKESRFRAPSEEEKKLETRPFTGIITTV